MTSFNKASGFITLTVVLIIVLLITALTLMTGKMLMGEQRSASNQVRYHEAMNAAQAGLDKAIIQLMDNFENQTNLNHLTAAPYYHVTFGNVVEVPLGSSTIKTVTINSVGTAGYSASSATSTNAESQATVSQQVLSISPISATPAAPLTVAAGMAAGGNFTVAANPNGGGPGVPISIWSKNTVAVGSSSSTCGQQEYYDGTCSLEAYSSSKAGINSDILANDPNFPADLLSYIFNGSTSVQDVIDSVKSSYSSTAQIALHIGASGTGLTNCSSLDTSSKGIYVIRGTCSPPGDVGSRAFPVILLVVNGSFTMNANKNIYGIIFTYTEPSATGTYDVMLNGGATIYGALVSNFELGNSNGTYNAVYDAETLSNLSNSVESIVSTIPGSWRDW